MENQELIGQIIQDIKQSKKYKNVYGKTIERIVIDFVSRGDKPKEIEKKSKNLLHQIWGAFYSSRPDFGKILARLEQDLKDGKSVREAAMPILALQSSVKERIPILDEFYKKIFEVTGIPDSIVDHACGLNPLTLPWMNLPENATYKAFDIDEEEIGFLNSAFELLGWKNAKAVVGDILCEKSESADVVFLLKLLSCLEHQKKNSGLELLKALPCKYVVVSFPVKSIGGKKAGMGDFYSNNFKSMIDLEQWQVTELWFETELVFIIKK